MSRRWYGLRFPAGLDAASVLQFTRSLTARARHGFLGWSDPVVCEVEHDGERLRWRLGASHREADQVLMALRLALPNVQVATDDVERLRLPWACELRLSTGKRPLFDAAPEHVAAALLGGLADARPGEIVRLQWLIGPWIARRVVSPPTRSKHEDSGLATLGRLVLDSEERTALKKKQTEPLLGVVGRIGVRASSPARRKRLRQQVIGALQVMRAPGAGFERRLLPSFIVEGRMVRLTQPQIAWPAVLSASELVAAVGWPIGNPVLPGTNYGGARQLPPSSALLVRDQESRHGRIITGQATYPGSEGFVGLTPQALTHHVWALGPTGAGKSTALGSMAVQAIEDGLGVIVIDGSSKVDLIQSIAGRIPTHRLNDVTVLDPLDDCPVGLNVLDHRHPEEAVGSVLHVFSELWASSWGPRTADVLFHALTTLTARRLTLCELPPLLLNNAFRRSTVGDLLSDVLGVGPFWQQFEQWSDGERLAAVGPVLNKVRSFTQRAAVRGVIGQTGGLDLERLLTRRQVLLVPLGSLDAASGRLLGALLVGRLWSAIQGRGALPPERRAPVLLVLDEFQNLLHLPVDLGDAMAACRGLGVGLVLAHQHIGQLTSAIKGGVQANARSRIAWQLGAEDGTVMARLMGGALTPDDFRGLPPFETYQALWNAGATTSPASVRTLPLGEPLGSAAEVRHRSRERYGAARADVDAELIARRSTTSAGAPIGKRKRGGRS